MLTKQVSVKIGSNHSLTFTDGGTGTKTLGLASLSSSAKQNTVALSNQLQSVKELLTKTSQDLDKEKRKVSWKNKSCTTTLTGSVCSLPLAP